ncbi:MAG TPA: endonuclease III [Polyangiaceae bacterium]
MPVKKGALATAAARLVEGAVARKAFRGLRRAYPDAHCELDHDGAFQLIVATVLSAQSTDVGVNRVTPELFRRWPDAASLARAAQEDVEQALNRLGMFRQKARNIIGLAQRLVAEHSGQVPARLDALVELPGVGRKTANVVLGVAFGRPEGVVVDTHVQRLSQRLGFTACDSPVDIERDLMRLFPKRDWDILSHTLIFHGRRLCTARKPACAICPVRTHCPSAFHAEQVGRKPTRSMASRANQPKPKWGEGTTPAKNERPGKGAPGKKALQREPLGKKTASRVRKGALARSA